MKVTIEGSDLVVRLPLDNKGRLSESQKTIIHASSGNESKTDLTIDGRPLTVSINAYTPNPNKSKK